MSDYIPINCDIHSELELHTMHADRLRLIWDEDGITHTEILLPVDLVIRNKAEYLLCRDGDGGERAIRLDWLRKFEKAV